jgi:hypothetical protein
MIAAISNPNTNDAPSLLVPSKMSANERTATRTKIAKTSKITYIKMTEARGR